MKAWMLSKYDDSQIGSFAEWAFYFLATGRNLAGVRRRAQSILPAWPNYRP